MRELQETPPGLNYPDDTPTASQTTEFDDDDDTEACEEFSSDSHIDDNIHEINFMTESDLNTDDDDDDPYHRSLSDYPKIRMWSDETTTPANYSHHIERMRQTSSQSPSSSLSPAPRRIGDNPTCRVLRALATRCICLLAVSIPIVAYISILGRDSARAVTHQVQELIEENKNKMLFGRLPDSTSVLRRLAFGSCSSQDKPLGYWDTVASLLPDVTILTGDNVYAACEEEMCDGLRMAYMSLANHPSFIGAKGRLPMIETMNDQDYGAEDCDEENPFKDAAKWLFLEFFEIPKSDDRWRDGRGVYTSYIWGVRGQMVQVILLDVRYHRSPFLETDEEMAPRKEKYVPDKDDQTKTMLGEEQWAWFEHQLTITADIRLIVSSIQVLAEGHGFECWRMLPHERRRFLISVANAKGGIPIILSGDRLVGGFYEMSDYGVVEVTASSWTHTIPYGAFDDCQNAKQCDEKDAKRIGDLVRVNHFGSIDIDWDNRKVKVTLRSTESSLPQHERGTNAGEIIQSQTFDIPKNT